MLKIKQFDPNQDELSTFSQIIFDILKVSDGHASWSLNFIETDLMATKSVYYFAEIDKKIVGFLSTIDLVDEIEISNIAVLPEKRGQGIASHLIEKIPFDWGHQQMDGTIKTIFLEVRATNLPAQRLYEKYDFDAFHIRKNYYTEPQEDAILMRRTKKISK
ncbi:ribosomal protein S18-alanine N-acetyltransferase [Lactococcus fujiensis]|uniref:ribosomal protein S18-alanine N-acetyltransferase n=1 Tax=Lactococcus fujiensis TaxID=610251 RepID=UPI0006D26B8F|nr:ribosomal protein S18-alanine N-acetyltransferase [Lactococcus fujiensis]